eukprot:jgi/Bigna1/84841/estExt_fgenesh1_pg.C_10193
MALIVKKLLLLLLLLLLPLLPWWRSDTGFSHYVLYPSAAMKQLSSVGGMHGGDDDIDGDKAADDEEKKTMTKKEKKRLKAEMATRPRKRQPKRCELEEEGYRSSVVAAVAVAIAAGFEDWEEGSIAYESTVLLFTGRTHVIRSMAAHLGSPILGDTLYRNLTSEHSGAVPVVTHTRIALQACELKILDESETGASMLGGTSALTFHASIPWWRETHEKDE